MFIKDLNSRNGTFVNGSRTKQRRLTFGDIIQIGPFFIQVVRALAKGQNLFAGDPGATSIAEAIVEEEEEGERSSTGVLMEFTQREQQIIKLLADGYSEKQVAEMLKLSRHTVHSYVKKIYERLKIVNRSQLLAWYWRGRAK
jgi:DNA-binding NarL/FixJ family response regulator